MRKRERERERERERKKERKKNQGSSSEQCHFLDDKAAVFKARNAMQCPLLVLQCWQIIRRKATVRKLDDRLHPGVQSDRVQFLLPSLFLLFHVYLYIWMCDVAVQVSPTVSSRRARAACAPIAVTMASTRLQGCAPSEPGFEIQREVPLFSSQFHHFWTLSATDDHLDCFNQTFLCPFMQKNLGPLESGTESKKKRLFGLA